MAVPDRALYKCPEHGLFAVQTEGVVWKERCCPHRVGSLSTSGMSFPCGIFSPLAHIDDPDVSRDEIPGLDPSTMQTLRETINQIKEQRRQERMQQDGDKPTLIFGSRDGQNRRNGRLLPPAPPAIDREQQLFETAERERMRAAIDGWED